MDGSWCGWCGETGEGLARYKMTTQIGARFEPTSSRTDRIEAACGCQGDDGHLSVLNERILSTPTVSLRTAETGETMRLLRT